MTVLILTNASPSVRGRLRLWMIEIAGSVYVGTLTQRVRDTIWNDVVTTPGRRAAAVMYWSAPGTQRFMWRTKGHPDRTQRVVDGLLLSQRRVTDP